MGYRPRLRPMNDSNARSVIRSWRCEPPSIARDGAHGVRWNHIEPMDLARHVVPDATESRRDDRHCRARRSEPIMCHHEDG